MNFNGVPGYSPYESGYEDYGVSYDHGSGGKEMTLKKIYELALIAIAYIAFGIFVLQVIICIASVSFFLINFTIGRMNIPKRMSLGGKQAKTHASMMMVPTDGVDGGVDGGVEGGAEGGVDAEGRHRQKRSLQITSLTEVLRVKLIIINIFTDFCFFIFRSDQCHCTQRIEINRNRTRSRGRQRKLLEANNL